MKDDVKSGDLAQTAVDTFLAFTDEAVAAYYEACVHCGECAEACHFYLSTGDPKYTPTYKLFPMVRAYKREKAPFAGLKKALGLAPRPVTEQEIRDWEELVYDSCTMCGRCTLVCPMGIDIAGTIRKVREGYAAVGLVPKGLTDLIANVERTTSPMGITPKALLKQIEIQEKATGIKVEVDKVGADYMVILSSMEIMGFPEVIGAYARIFKAAGVDWTISTKAYEGTNLGVQMGSSKVAREIVQRTVDEAERLGVKYLISPECGHAYGAIRWAGPNLIGRPFKFEVVHVIELLDQLRREGRLPPVKRDARRLTLHDPCQIVRRGGLLKEPRDIIGVAAEDYVPMPGDGVVNFCCGGGGGVSANPRAEELKLKAFAPKQEQLDAIDGLEGVVVPCANCRTVFEDALDDRGIELDVLGLTELLADAAAALEADDKA